MASLQKNVAGQNVTFCLVNATSGAALSGATVTVYVTQDGAAQVTSSATVVSQGNGQYNMKAIQSDTNATDVGFLFVASSAIPVNADFHTDVVDGNGLLQVDLVDIAGSAVSTSTAQLGVNLVNIVGVAVSTSTAQIGVNVVKYNQQTAVTDGNNFPSVNLVDIAGATVSTTTAQLGVNTVKYNNQTAQTDANNLPKVDVEDVVGVAVSISTATFGVNLVSVNGVALSTHASGMLPADVRDIAGSAVSTTSAQLGVNVVQYNTQTAVTDGNNFPSVNVADVVGVAVSTSTAQFGVNVVKWNQQTALTDANNLPKVDVEDIVGVAVSTSTAQFGVNVVKINQNSVAAVQVAIANATIGRGTCATLGSTTSVTTSAWTPGGAGIVSGQFIGRTMIFDYNTATTSLQGQATTITANTSGATPTFTVTALTTAPSSGDTFGVY